MSEPLIRPAAIDDAAELAAVRVQSWRWAYRDILPAPFLERMNAGEDERRWRELMNRDGREDIVCAADSLVVGFVTICPNRDGEPERVGEVAAIYLLPQACGRGLGRLLWQAALRRLRERGFAGVTVWVFRDNPRARRFYKRAGMRQDNQRPITIEQTELIEVRYRLDVPGDPRSTIHTQSSPARLDPRCPTGTRARGDGRPLG